MIMTTGYFANEKESTKVHLVDGMTGKPICGSVIGKDKVYQWCAHSIVISYVECDKCRNKRRKAIDEENKRDNRKQ